MSVTNTQVQNAFDSHVRPGCNRLVALKNMLSLFKAGDSDIYNYLSGANDFADSRDDVLHKAAPADFLAFDTVADAFGKFVAGTATLQDVANFSGQWPIVLKLCRDQNAS